MNKGLLFSAIKDFFKNCELKTIDDYPIKLTNGLCNFINENGNLPNENQIKKIIDDINTNFFLLNRKITKAQFTREIMKVIPNIQILDLEIKDNDMINILFLASNPKDTCRLRLGEEMRAIDHAIRSSNLREKINLKQQWAVRSNELLEHFLRFKPNILHFSGHGSEESEIILEDEMGNSIPVPTNALSQLFKIFKDQIKIVVLNACYSEVQARSIVEHIPYVIGMVNTISDRAAITFSAAFYQALAYDQNVETAFSLALTQINLLNIQESDIPILLKK